jgi:hypothetical protein
MSLELRLPEKNNNSAKNIEEKNISEIEVLKPKEIAEILAKTEIHSSDYLGKKLTVEILEQKGLAPKFKIYIENGPTVYLSLTYELGNERIGTVAYVEMDEHVVARSFYRSNSQCVWRYLPSYHVHGDEVGWYAKGYGEESITLPILLQKTLAEIGLKEKPRKIEDANFVLAGTARNIPNYESHHEQETHRVEVNSSPLTFPEDFYNYKKIFPDKLKLNPEDSPNFSKLIASWTEQSELYDGPVIVEVFSSKDKELSFMFCRDKNNRVWIGGIDNNSAIQSTGVRKTWISGGDLTTPAYEYISQNSGYGNFGMRKGEYVDMFENYLKKAPIIQEYLLTKGLITKEEIDNINSKNEKTETIKVISTIKSAKNFQELFWLIDNLPDGGLRGTESFYSATELKSIINKILFEGLGYKYLTREGGLRDKVWELAKKAFENSPKSKKKNK